MTKKMNVKKVKQFLENNFPPYYNYTILEETNNKVTVLLDYGKNEEKLKVAIGYTDDTKLYRLLNTDLV